MRGTSRVNNPFDTQADLFADSIRNEETDTDVIISLTNRCNFSREITICLAGCRMRSGTSATLRILRSKFSLEFATLRLDVALHLQ